MIASTERPKERHMTKQPRRIARFIKRLDGFRGQAALYSMHPPLEGNDYVIVSAVRVMVSSFDYGSETSIFPADSDGNVTDWCELVGSQKGTLAHSRALESAGYEMLVRTE